MDIAEKVLEWVYSLERSKAGVGIGRCLAHEYCPSWSKHAIRPHRVDGYMSSNAGDFETKAADVIGLLPCILPNTQRVFSVDEKTAIQALDRQDPVLPLTAGPSRAPWL